MKVYIQCDGTGMPYNLNTYSAMLGFRQMGFETILFYDPKELKNSELNDVIAGGVGRVRGRLEEFGIIPAEIDYPKELMPYLGRRIWQSTIKEVIQAQHRWPLFMKPLTGKLFPGKVVASERDLIGSFQPKSNPAVLCSEVLSFRREWRCFVRYGKILDIRSYKGDLRAAYDYHVIAAAVRDYQSAPAAYGIDFGITSNGETRLVEVNDGYSLGSYGLDPLLYAKLLAARWAEITRTEDECAFD